MREDWKEVRIKDFCEFKYGKNLPAGKRIPGQYPVFGSSGITGWHNDYLIEGPGIIIGRKGTVGKVQFSKENFFPIDTAYYISEDKSIVDLKYLYYRLPLCGLEEMNSDAAIPGLNRNAAISLKLKLPPLPTQRKISSILSAYDDLIENNLKRIKLLEEKAQLTYEEWFVRMKFPGHETAKFDEESGLPEGWEKKYFDGILNFKTGKLDSNALKADGEFDFYTCAKEVYKTDTYCFEGEAVLLGGNNATGDFALFYANNKFDAYQRTYIVTSEKQILPLVFVFFYLKMLLPYFQIVSSGASTKFLTMKILNKTKILVPDSAVLKKYESITKPCFDSVLLFQNQNQLLKEARDILLPRLMSGMIDPSEISGGTVEELGVKL